MYYALGRPDAYCRQYPGPQFVEGVCSLSIRHKPLRAGRLFKARTLVLHIDGGRGFDLYGTIDLGPLTWRKVYFNRKKNKLKVVAVVPAGLAPGPIQVRVGDCTGWIEIE